MDFRRSAPRTTSVIFIAASSTTTANWYAGTFPGHTFVGDHPTAVLDNFGATVPVANVIGSTPGSPGYCPATFPASLSAAAKPIVGYYAPWYHTIRDGVNF